MSDKYWPADIAEQEPRVSLISRPVREEVIELRPGQSAASLHALLVGCATRRRRDLLALHKEIGVHCER